MNLFENSQITEDSLLKRFCSSDASGERQYLTSTIRYKKGQYIFHEGDLVYGIYIIQTGKVKVISTGYNGKTQIIRLARPGYLLGFRGLGAAHYMISAIALEDATLCFIETETFTQILQNDAILSYQLMLFFANELRLAESRMKNLAQMTVREKSAEALLLIKQVFGSRSQREIVLDNSLSRKDIAELVGMSPEQITRSLSEFKKEGFIQVSGKAITLLNPDALYKLVAPYFPSPPNREPLGEARHIRMT